MIRPAVAAVAVSSAFGFFGAATAHAAAPPVARPNPALVEIRLDYVSPLRGVSGAPAALAALYHAVIAQAVADQRYLAYQSTEDLGGFLPAPVGRFAVSSGGHNVVGAALGVSQIPQLAQAAGGQVNSFAALGGASFTPPETGTQPVPGLGVPPQVTPPSNSNAVPPPNQGFGGLPPQLPPTTTTEPATTTAPAPPPPTTTAPTTTTTPTTTTAPTTTNAAPAGTTPSPPAPPGPTNASCGVTGMTITSDHATCRLYAVNMAPGGSVFEVLTVRNDSGQPFSLALRAAGSVSSFWNDLELGVWEVGTAPPTPFPALVWWTSQYNTLDTLQPGQTIRYRVELFLPPSVGNADQGLSASIDFSWRAQG